MFITPKTSHYSKEYSFSKSTSPFFELPIESLAFVVASCVAFFFKFKAASAFVGVALGLCTAKLAAKVINLYNPEVMIGFTKEACKLARRYPRLQFISFLITLLINTTSKQLGLALGAGLGIFGAVILDVERYKYLRQAK